VRSVQASFGFALSNPKGDIRMKPELGGGALLDAGCYPLSLIRLLMGSAPQSVHAVASWTETGVDMSVAATLYYIGGVRAQLTCAMDAANHRLAHIIGTQGVITTEYLNHTGSADDPYGYRPNEMRIRRGAGPFEDLRSDDRGSGFRFAVEAFARLIAERDHEAIRQANDASLDNAATLEALALSAKEMRTVDLGSLS
jgi:predicted dehydrogenase